MMNKTKLSAYLVFLLLLIGSVYLGMTANTKLKTIMRMHVNEGILNKEQTETPKLAIIPIGNNPKMGDDLAPVKMIIYLDYQCPFCEKFVKEYLKVLDENYISTGQLQIIFSDLPLKSHSESHTLALFANQMYEEGRYGVFLDKVWESTNESTDFNSLSAVFGVTVSENVLAEKFQGRIDKSILYAGIAGITSTPTFVINNRTLVGLRSLQDLRSLIDYSLENTIQDQPSDSSCGGI